MYKRQFPDNFNELNIDGNTADTGDIVSPTLPGAFIAQADGTLKLNTDYFTGAELTGTNPQVVTYTINPKATWNLSLIHIYRLSIVNALGYRLHPIEPGVAGDQEPFIAAAARVDLRLEVLPGCLLYTSPGVAP